MEKEIILPGDNAKEAIIAIGQTLIERAEDITNDLNMVKSITIYANIQVNEAINFDITKNYIATLKDNKEDK